MKVFYSDQFDLALPPGHRFPGRKYGMLRRALLDEGVLGSAQLHPSPSASREELLRAHDGDYIDAIEDGSIDPSAMRRIGFPWSPHIPRRANATMGGAIAAARHALNDGIAGQLAGGTHHAHRAFGSGYCVFNDFAVAGLTMLDEGLVDRIAIIDLDVHQGDGNAAILASDPRIFIFSIHGEKNFPFRKVPSDLDIALPDGVQDEAYLDALTEHLPSVWAFNPDLILFQAGVDPLAVDKLGRMALTHEGLMARDKMVLSQAKARGIPVSMAIGGGYADPISATVTAYVNTYRVAADLYGLSR